ncbi:hypothetical protein [Niallia sp. 03133]|uniref:hypothetical protein n=1 Tax=Niallia sp. 03133 TaxID=3458060 RepID=UPI0040448C9F
MIPSFEEHKEIQKRLSEVATSSEFQAKIRTPQEQEELDKLMREVDTVLNFNSEEPDLEDNE